MQYSIRVGDSIRVLHVVGHAVVDPDGKHRGSVMIGREITTERALLDRSVQSQKLEAIGRLAGRIAHDFNNVLTPIICSTSLLELEQLTEEGQESVAAIQEGVEHAAAITRQLLGLSRQESTGPRIVEVDREIGRMRPLLKQLMGERIALSYQLGAEGCVVGLAPHELGQVFLNLCVNGRDAVHGEGRVRVETQLSAGQVELTVHDSGIGISVDVQRRMFEPFYTTKDPDRGTGLGLSTVRELVDRAGGVISVTSELGAGAKIKVRLPLIATVPAHIPPTRPKAISLPPQRILLVDDNAALRQTLAYVLALRQHNVKTSATVARTKQLIEQHTFDVVVTDVLLGDGRGDEVLADARRAQPQVKVVVISGFAGETFAMDDLPPGDATFLQKPFHPNELIESISGLLSDAASQIA